MAALLVVGGFGIFSRTFRDVMLDRASSATILVLIIGVLAYLITRTIMGIKTAATLVNPMAIYLMATLFFPPTSTITPSGGSTPSAIWA